MITLSTNATTSTWTVTYARDETYLPLYVWDELSLLEFKVFDV